MNLSIHDIAKLLHGTVISPCQIIAPGPNHTLKDRSLSIKLDDSRTEGFILHSFSGDDLQTCRHYVREKLGLTCKKSNTTKWHTKKPVYASGKKTAADVARDSMAMQIWDASCVLQGSLAEEYLRYRIPNLDVGLLVSDVLRYHPECLFGKDIRHPALIALFRDV